MMNVIGSPDIVRHGSGGHRGYLPHGLRPFLKSNFLKCLVVGRTISLLQCLLFSSILLQGGAAYAASQNSREIELTEFKVCADPRNLPFSNRAEEGFENKIAKLIAEDLGLPLSFVWMPQSVGFVRSTLNTRVCDVILGMVSGDDLVQNSNPYYRSTYAIVTRSSDGFSATELSSPEIKGHAIGVVAGTPPVDALVAAGYAAQLRPYRLVVDTRYNAMGQDMINDLTSGAIDYAILWGPIAGYFAKHSQLPLKVTPLVNEPDKLRIEYRITMGVRHNEPKLKHLLNDEIKKLKPQIEAVLNEYGVPRINDDDQVIAAPNQ
jgi:quinoprotein dehydrogenase-associated probable ABC transporter substrate-binding protein